MSVDPNAAPGGPSNVEADISKAALTALIAGIAGWFCCPLIGIYAIISANKTEALIEQHNVGQEHAIKASIGKILGYIVLVLMVLGIVFQILMAVLAVGGAAAG